MGGVGSVYVRSASTLNESAATSAPTAILHSVQQLNAENHEETNATLQQNDAKPSEHQEHVERRVEPAPNDKNDSKCSVELSSQDMNTEAHSEVLPGTSYAGELQEPVPKQGEPTPNDKSDLERSLDQISTSFEARSDVSMTTSYSEELDEQEIERLTTDSASDLRSFRERLSKLRSARQQAFSQKSREMRELREDLARERNERQRLERLLSGGEARERLAEEEDSVQVTACSGQVEASLREDWKRLPEDIDRLRERLRDDRKEAKKVQIDNKRLNVQIECLKVEIGALRGDLLKREDECSEWQRKCERLERDSSGQDEDVKRLEGKVKALEEEKKSMWEEYDREKEEISKRTTALKEVIRVSREMLQVRELQVTELKDKLKEIEESFADKLRETDLKAEYEKQMQQIKELKELYEERNRILDAEHVQLNARISELQEELSDLNLKYEIAAEEVDTERERVKELLADLAHLTVKARESQKELTLMNTLLTQMLIGPGPPGTRALDRITEQLQQNHDLITQMTSCEECSYEAAHLPKLLLDLCSQIEDGETEWPLPTLPTTCDVMTDSTDDPSTISEPSVGLPIVSYKNAKVFTPPPIRQEEEREINPSNPTGGATGAGGGGGERGVSEATLVEADPAVQEIVSNLPKVWRVLSELLSHHTAESPPGETRNCYKRVDTPEGPRTVISVSDTFIRLKELIIEKKGLVREVSRLRHLNSHLETRLDDQEKRLSSVQCELHKTWGVVGRMRAQHQQLHNQEKILRYELQEKRIMVNELKSELDDCRDLWERARRKNNESETECFKLRSEFAARRAKTLEQESGSGESGFSDEDHCDADRSSTPSPTPMKRRRDSLKKVRSLDCEVGESSRSSRGVSMLNAACSSEPVDSWTVAKSCEGVLEGERGDTSETACQVVEKVVENRSTDNALSGPCSPKPADPGTVPECSPILTKVPEEAHLETPQIELCCKVAEDTAGEGSRDTSLSATCSSKAEDPGTAPECSQKTDSEMVAEELQSEKSEIGTGTETALQVDEEETIEISIDNLAEIYATIESTINGISTEIENSAITLNARGSEGAENISDVPQQAQGSSEGEVSEVESVISPSTAREFLHPRTSEINNVPQVNPSHSQVLNEPGEIGGNLSQGSQEPVLFPRETSHPAEDLNPVQELMSAQLDEGLRSEAQLIDDLCGDIEELSPENLEEIAAACGLTSEDISEEHRIRVFADPLSKTNEIENSCSGATFQSCVLSPERDTQEPLLSDESIENLGACSLNQELSELTVHHRFTPTATLDSILSNEDVCLPESSTSEDQTELAECDQVTVEERLRAREARALRLQRLEEQCLLLVRKVDINTHRSKFFVNRLEELHEHYSTSPSMASEPQGSSECSSSSTAGQNEAGTRDVLADGAILEEIQGEVAKDTEQGLAEKSEQNSLVSQQDLTDSPFQSSSEPEEVRYEQIQGSENNLRLLENSERTVSPRTETERPACSNRYQTTTAQDSCSKLNFSISNQESDTHFEELTPSTSQSQVQESLEYTQTTPQEPPTSQERVNSIADLTVEHLPTPLQELRHSISEELNAAIADSSLELPIQSQEPRPSTSQEEGSHETSTFSSQEPTPSTSQERDTSLATFDERMARREERLKRLEEAASSLHGKVSNQINRGNVMSDRLQEIHEAEVKRKQEEALKTRAAEMKYLPLRAVAEEGEDDEEEEED